MGELRLTDTSPEQTLIEPISTLEMKEFLRVPVLSPTDEQQDTEIDGLTAGAREMAEAYQNRDLAGRQWDLWFDYFERVVFQLRHPLSSVDLIQYTDSVNVSHDLVEDTDYIVDTVKATVQPVYGGSWPSCTPYPALAVLIRFTTGAAVVSQTVHVGIKLLTSDWYFNRLPRNIGDGDLPMHIQRLLEHGAIPRVR